MIKINHVALNVHNLEYMKNFYCNLFDLTANNLYENIKKNIKCYFLSSNDGFSRLELIENNNINEDIHTYNNNEHLGFAHISFSIGSKENIELKVHELINKYKEVKIIDGPRVTGDGSFFASFTDPEGNLVELTI